MTSAKIRKSDSNASRELRAKNHMKIISLAPEVL
jgi:ribosomal protein L14